LPLRFFLFFAPPIFFEKGKGKFCFWGSPSLRGEGGAVELRELPPNSPSGENGQSHHALSPWGVCRRNGTQWTARGAFRFLVAIAPRLFLEKSSSKGYKLSTNTKTSAFKALVFVR